jgi:hypothetical protein
VLLTLAVCISLFVLHKLFVYIQASTAASAAPTEPAAIDTTNTNDMDNDNSTMPTATTTTAAEGNTAEANNGDVGNVSY